MIHWDEATGAKVVLEHPDILESYILMPVFGFHTMDVFKRRIYVRLLPPDDLTSVVMLIFEWWYISGFDSVPHPTLGEDADPQVAAWGTALSLCLAHHDGLTMQEQNTVL